MLYVVLLVHLLFVCSYKIDIVKADYKTVIGTLPPQMRSRDTYQWTCNVALGVLL